MKYILSFLLLLAFSVSFAQWTKVQQLPSTNMFTLFHKDNTLYAGGTNVIYVSNDKGQTWDSTTAIPGLSPVTSIISNIIVYKNELYASVPSKGVFKSADAGTTWQNISAGIFPQVMDLCEYRGNLYAATEGNFGSPVFKLDPVSKNHWLSFSEGLSGISTVINSIAGNSNVLITGANNNSLYDYLPANSTTWEERFLTDPPIKNEGVFDIITGHDTLFLAGKTGFFYMSTDDGVTWNFFGNRLVTGATFIVNAKQALISSRYIFDQITGANTTLFYYIKKDSLQHPFQNFSVVANHFTWKIDILGDKLWDASDRGLFYMSLSDLPGITAADDGFTTVPVHFTLFNAACDNDKVLVKWKTAQEQNSSHYNIERSGDGIHWIVIGNLPASGNSSNENDYAFTDHNPVQNNYYRIAAYNKDGKVSYSTTINANCAGAAIFIVFPNPVHDQLSVNIVSRNNAKIVIQLFDGKGALVKLYNKTLLQGNNPLKLDVKPLAKGTYYLSATWNDGQQHKMIRLMKE